MFYSILTRASLQQYAQFIKSEADSELRLQALKSVLKWLPVKQDVTEANSIYSAVNTAALDDTVSLCACSHWCVWYMRFRNNAISWCGLSESAIFYLQSIRELVVPSCLQELMLRSDILPLFLGACARILNIKLSPGAALVTPDTLVNDVVRTRCRRDL